MRRLLPLLSTLPAAVAVVGTAAGGTTSGKITALSPTRIAVEGSRDMSCRIGPASPPALHAFAIGWHVVISCREGLLTGIRRAAGTLPGPSVSSAATASWSSGAPPSANAVLVGENVPITALTATSITVAAGAVSVVCKLDANSPTTAGYRAGDRIARLECRNGMLTRIVP